MTIPRAIAMLQDFIDFKLKAAELMRRDANGSTVGDLARQAADLHDKEREKIEQILKELGPESEKTGKTRDPSIKDMIAEEVRIQITRELKTLKIKRYDIKRKKKSL